MAGYKKVPGKKVKMFIAQKLKDSELRDRRLFEAAQGGILIRGSGTGLIEYKKQLKPMCAAIGFHPLCGQSPGTGESVAKTNLISSKTIKKSHITKRKPVTPAKNNEDALLYLLYLPGLLTTDRDRAAKQLFNNSSKYKLDTSCLPCRGNEA
jgi:hypothetical protein